MNWFEVLTIIGIFLGGIWALVVFFFNMKQKHDESVIAQTKEEVEKLTRVLTKFQDNFLGLEKEMTKKFHEHDLELQSLKHSMKATTEELRTTRDSMGKIYSNFKEHADKLIQTTVKEIRQDVFRVGQTTERKK